MLNQTFDAIVKVMDRGLLVIPKGLREEMGWVKNTYLSIKKTSDGILIKPVTSSIQDDGVYTVNGLKIYPAKIRDKKEALKILERTRGIWSEKDYQEWKKMRDKEKARTKKIIKWEPYW